MEEKLKDIICEVLQCDDCIAHCNYPPCHKVKQLTETLLRNGVILPPCNIGDVVYYISGIHNTLIKEARIDEIYYCGYAFGYHVQADYTGFDLTEDEVYFTRAAAEKAIEEKKQR